MQRALCPGPLSGLFGYAAGLAPPMSRRNFIAAIPPQSTLEIGPFDAPQLHGPHVRYFDVLPREGLQARAIEHHRNPEGVPEIDYISPTGDLAVVDARFDAVFSSHAIEHQPDLVRHLHDVSALLPAGGRYYVIIPDKRFTFDHLLPPSTLDEVLAGHDERRMVHTPQAVRAHYEQVTHNQPLLHWIGMHGVREVERDASVRAKADAAAQEAADGHYVDVHAWIFTPTNFHDILHGLRQRGLTDLAPVMISNTKFAALEFYAVLEKR